MSYIARIYKITNTINNDIYIGSTKNALRIRLQQHRAKQKQVKNSFRNGLYCMMNEYDSNHFHIELIEEIECLNKREQTEHEQRIINQYKPVLNKKRAYGIKCEHNKNNSICKICKGGHICIHNRTRSRCKLCKGSQICTHDRMRSSCKDCKGSGVCEHNKIKRICKDCKGLDICEHNKNKRICKDCGGSSICEHNKYKDYCKECNGSRITLIYCFDCDDEFRRDNLRRHYNSVKHLRNTLPVNY
jgi:predicted GIY-YIG superfamily endonuclease